MAERSSSPTTRGAADLRIDAAVAATLRTRLPAVAEHTVAAVTVEVPGYAGALSGEMGANIENAVQMALGGFLNLASRSAGSDPRTPLGPALEAAYALGRGEARSGRSMDALLAAYRVGARVAWRELSGAVVETGLDAETVAKFAELVFAYIDELSASSVAGHSDQLATTGRVRQRYLELLSKSLLAGAPVDALVASAERADWQVPRTLTAVLLPANHQHGLASQLDPGTLQYADDLPGLESDDETAVLLVPDADGRDRRQLLRALSDRSAVVGPARPWTEVRASYLRALHAMNLRLDPGSEPIDTEQHLTELVLGADPDALEDLQKRVLAPLAGLRPAAAERLRETLRSWLLHQGRRDDVAADLFVHAQTVRYRMGQIRELYGDRLNDPRVVLDLTIALNRPASAGELTAPAVSSS